MFRRLCLRGGLALLLFLALCGAGVLAAGLLGFAPEPRPPGCPPLGGELAPGPRPALPGLHDADRACPLVRIAVLSNGAHLDLLLPAVVPLPETTRWPEIFPLPPGRPPAGDDAAALAGWSVYIGWGERDFYLATPTWEQVRLSSVLRAALGGPAALHVEYVPAPDLGSPGPQDAALELTLPQYRRLCGFILASTPLDGQGRAIPIPAPGFGANDRFYEARGRFSLAYTCNTWVADALAAAGQPAPLWTNLAWFVLYHLP